MDDAFLVRGFERVGDLARNGERFLERNRPPFDALGKGFALDQLHHQVVGADIVQRANTRVVQRGDRARFAFEAVAELLGGHLYSHFTVQARVGGAIDSMRDESKAACYLGS